jgi:hypothetical protein
VCVGRVSEDKQRQSVRRPCADKGGKVCVCRVSANRVQGVPGNSRGCSATFTVGNHFVFSKSAQYALATRQQQSVGRANDKVSPGG